MRYIDKAKPTWCKLLLQRVLSAAVLARDSEGNSSAAKIAIMAMTTSSSISVKAQRNARAERLETDEPAPPDQRGDRRDREDEA